MMALKKEKERKLKKKLKKTTVQDRKPDYSITFLNETFLF